MANSQPRAAAHITQTSYLALCNKEGLLRKVLRVVRRAGQAVRIRIHRLMVLGDQLGHVRRYRRFRPCPTL